MNIVGHSHGGNAIKEYTQMEGSRPIDSLVMMGTPHRSDHVLNATKVVSFVNVWSGNDVVQPNGGGEDGPTWDARLWDSASQTSKHADRNIQVSNYTLSERYGRRPARSSKVRHSQCRSGCIPLASGPYGLNGPEVWRRHVDPFLP